MAGKQYERWDLQRFIEGSSIEEINGVVEQLHHFSQTRAGQLLHECLIQKSNADFAALRTCRDMESPLQRQQAIVSNARLDLTFLLGMPLLGIGEQLIEYRSLMEREYAKNSTKP